MQPKPSSKLMLSASYTVNNTELNLRYVRKIKIKIFTWDNRSGTQIMPFPQDRNPRTSACKLSRAHNLGKEGNDRGLRRLGLPC